MLLIIPGPPNAQKRHRNCTKQGKSWLYDPSSSDKKKLQENIKHLSTHFNCEVEGFFLELSFRFFIKTPKAYNKKLQELCRNELVICCHKPDVDNYVKFYMDAMTGVFYNDDAFIQIGGATKYFSSYPRTEIELRLQPKILAEARVYPQQIQAFFSEGGIERGLPILLPCEV